MNLIERALKKDTRAMAKILSAVENGEEGSVEYVKRLYPYSGKAYSIGITGSPGTGKSTLVNKLTENLRSANNSVAIIAVDPSSAFSGGAILADRIRMEEHFLDERVFIRSMATRGNLGGLAKTTNDVIKVVDACGFDFILVETVGVGQDEVDVVKVSKTTLVVLAPGMGDDLQAMKAGIMEIGDIFVVNKGDHEGADKTMCELEELRGLQNVEDVCSDDASGMGKKENFGSNGGAIEWLPLVVKTVATTGEGVNGLVDGIYKHKEFLESRCEKAVEKELMRGEAEILEILKERLLNEALSQTKVNGGIKGLAKKVALREMDAYTAAEKILEDFSSTSG